MDVKVSYKETPKNRKRGSYKNKESSQWTPEKIPLKGLKRLLGKIPKEVQELKRALPGLNDDFYDSDGVSIGEYDMVTAKAMITAMPFSDPSTVIDITYLSSSLGRYSCNATSVWNSNLCSSSPRASLMPMLLGVA